MTLPTAVSPRTTMAAVAPPRLWDGDDPARYDLLQSRVSGSLGPKDFLEEIWARDVVDLVWEIFRLRRIKADLMREAAHKGVLEILKPRLSLLNGGSSRDTAAKWACGDHKAAAVVNHVLASADLTMDAVHANTFSALIDRFEIIDRMTMMAEGRRDTVLREIDRHRTSFAQRLRHAIVNAEDAEFEAIASEDAKSLPHTAMDAARVLPASVAAQGNGPTGAASVEAKPEEAKPESVA